MRRFLISCAAALAATAPSVAQPGDPAAGRDIAGALCAGCHAIDAAGASPNPAAPPFREIGRRYPVEALEEALAEGILVGHDAPMPQFTFQPDEIDDLLAYLDGLSAR